MLGLVTTPGRAETTEVVEVADPSPRAGELLLRTLEVGVCGTDREISEGTFGVAPAGSERLLLGHEFLGVVEEGGHGFERGDIVAATVRRSCGHCEACGEGSPDACYSGDYSERGITRLDGFASDLATEAAEHLVPVPRSLGRLGVLAEPSSICARAIRHARAAAERQPWRTERALVIGAGAIGMLSTYFLRLDGFEVWVAGRSPGPTPKTELAEACGARYVSTAEISLAGARRGDRGLRPRDRGGRGRAGDAGHPGSPAPERGCVPPRRGRAQPDVQLDGQVLGVDTILQNRALLGSVNAHARDWDGAVERLDSVRERWPDALERFVGLRVPVDRFAEAFGFAGVKATLRF